LKILVTGATGLLGSELCRRLSGPHEVTGWARHVPAAGASGSAATPACAAPGAAGRRLSAAAGGLGWKSESVDVTQVSSVQEGVNRLRPRLVVHAAAMTDVDACEKDPASARRMNAEATGILAAACAGAGAVLLAISTDYVFDGASPAPYRESETPNPISLYGRSKLKGEQEALSLAPRVMIVRVSGLFGPARDNFVSLAARRLRAGEKVPAVTDQVNSPSYTVDLAEGIAQLIALLERSPDAAEQGGPLHGVFHLANQGGASRLQVAEAVARILGAPPSLILQTRWADLDRPARRPPQSQLDCSRFAQTVGRYLRTWEEALQAFLLN